MREGDFDLFAKLVKTKSGIHLTPDKAYLLESRLMSVARQQGMKNIDDLLTVSCRAGEPFPMPLHPLTLQMHMPHTFMHKPSTQMSGLNT